MKYTFKYYDKKSYDIEDDNIETAYIKSLRLYGWSEEMEKRFEATRETTYSRPLLSEIKINDVIFNRTGHYSYDLYTKTVIARNKNIIGSYGYKSHYQGANHQHSKGIINGDQEFTISKQLNIYYGVSTSKTYRCYCEKGFRYTYNEMLNRTTKENNSFYCDIRHVPKIKYENIKEDLNKKGISFEYIKGLKIILIRADCQSHPTYKIDKTLIWLKNNDGYGNITHDKSKNILYIEFENSIASKLSRRYFRE